MTIEHVYIIEGDIQRRHHRVCNTQVHQKVISNRPHPLVSQHDPNHYEIATRRDHDHPRE